MSVQLLVLVSGLYVLLGLLIIIKNQFPPFPLRETRGVIDQDARKIGISWLIPGIVTFVGLPLIGVFTPNQQYQQTVRLLSLIVHLLVLYAWYITYTTNSPARRVEIEKPKRKHMPMPDVLTVSEAARYLKVEEIYVLHMIEDGELKAKAIGGDYRIPKEALEAFLRS